MKAEMIAHMVGLLLFAFLIAGTDGAALPETTPVVKRCDLDDDGCKAAYEVDMAAFHQSCFVDEDVVARTNTPKACRSICRPESDIYNRYKCEWHCTDKFYNKLCPVSTTSSSTTTTTTIAPAVTTTLTAVSIASTSTPMENAEVEQWKVSTIVVSALAFIAIMLAVVIIIIQRRRLTRAEKKIELWRQQENHGLMETQPPQ